MNKAINNIVKKNLCTGCAICAEMFQQTIVEMKISPDGFLRPKAIRELSHSEVDLFNTVCPGSSISHLHRNNSFTPIWGPVKEVMTGHAADDEVRHKGSSGGIVSALAIHLLETRQVHGVLHIVSSDQNPFENVAQISYAREDILRGAGSRYAPAAPLSRLSDCLNQEGMFAFIGKPCDVAALRSLMRTHSEIEKKFPLLIAFMCAGTPNLNGTKEIIQEMGFDFLEVSNFRYRGNGWPGKARAETIDGRSAEMDYDTSWGRILGRYVQFRCKICPDGTGEFADVSCADAWNTDEKGYPLFTENQGRSLIIARTDKGLSLIKEAQAHNKILLDACSLTEAEKMQPYQVQRKRTLLARLIGFKLAFKTAPNYRNMGLFAAAKESSFIKQLKAVVGSWLRGLKSS
ncbi:MAG: Coenzyme F420 hydrogenase/dehydrogenase, beta subunit C-terminal domain [Betaproteobacteria bacterium]|nr:Coenzyme F420 hydrogenase/dehydrogenase, beta subunit C-terminal domain [Betaproteobacteria bacterium]